MTAAPAAERSFALFLDIEQQARHAPSTEELAYCMVNQPQALFGFRHAALLVDGRVLAVTGVTRPSPQAPFVSFMERACRLLLAKNALQQTSIVDAALLDRDCRNEWLALSAPEALWIPLKDRDGQLFAGLWLAREQPWHTAEQQLADQLGAAFSHAWLALAPRRRWQQKKALQKPLAAGLLATALLAIPVPQSVLAPAEVIPLDARIVTAPLDGVVKEFAVQPNQPVQAGDVLVRFDDTALQAQADVAAQALKVAEAEYRATAQQAFRDAASKARLDLLAARVEQQRAEQEYARALLDRAVIRADQPGIAVFTDREEWSGRPVRTGERLMQLADAGQASLRIALDVGDAIQLEDAAPVTLFLDSDPLTPRAARLERASYEAELTPAGNLAYQLEARFQDAPPRIGLRGTARIRSGSVPLAVYLFRRPLASIRQMIGW